MPGIEVLCRGRCPTVVALGKDPLWEDGAEGGGLRRVPSYYHANWAQCKCWSTLTKGPGCAQGVTYLASRPLETSVAVEFMWDL